MMKLTGHIYITTVQHGHWYHNNYISILFIFFANNYIAL